MKSLNFNVFLGLIDRPHKLQKVNVTLIHCLNSLEFGNLALLFLYKIWTV